jgi:hypothetical protein
MPETIIYTGVLAVEECCTCHIHFAIPRDFQRRCRETRGTFYCPAGHGQAYTSSELDKVKAKLAREERWRREAETRARAAEDQAQAASRSAAAYKGQVTKIKKRVGNGVCPCCNRIFVQLARHMSTKHPDYRDAEVKETGHA